MKFYLCNYDGKSDIFCTYAKTGISSTWFAKFFVSDSNVYITDKLGNVTNIIIKKKQKQIMFVYPEDVEIIKELNLNEVPKNIVKIFTKLSNDNISAIANENKIAV
jgi:hypothetical protein